MRVYIAGGGDVPPGLQQDVASDVRRQLAIVAVIIVAIGLVVLSFSTRKAQPMPAIVADTNEEESIAVGRGVVPDPKPGSLSPPAAPTPQQTTINETVPAQDIPAPSLDDTLAWLKSRVEAWSQTESSGNGRKFYDKHTLSFTEAGILTLRMDGTMINTDGTSTTGDSVYSWWYEDVVALADLDTVDTSPIVNYSSITYARPYYDVYLRANRPIIRQSSSDGAIPTTRTSIEVPIVDQESAERVAKAFRVAMELAKKKGPF